MHQQRMENYYQEDDELMFTHPRRPSTGYSNRDDMSDMNFDLFEERQGRNYRPPRLNPERYDGSDDFDTYLEHFEVVGNLSGWSNKEKALTLAGCLQGQARRFYSSLSPYEKYNYKMLVYQLQQRFGGNSRHDAYWMTQFESRYRQAGETLAKFSDELLLLVRKAYPYLDENTQNHIALQQWYKSFCPEVRWRCQERNCRWIREAEEIADLYEAIMQPKEKRRNVSLVHQDREYDNPDSVQSNEEWEM
jgi:hypothetical protein